MHQNHFIFMNEPLKCERCLDALNMSLARMYAMPINFYLGLLEGEAFHVNGGCINTYLRNLVCSTHSLACKIFSHPMAWWICRQVDLWCLHFQLKCPLFVDDLLWNGGGHQCALFLHIEPDCWLAWLHSHYHIAMALSWTRFQSHSRWPSSKVFVHNNYRRICIRLRWLIIQHYFASLMTMKQVIFPIINMCWGALPFNLASYIVWVGVTN